MKRKYIITMILITCVLILSCNMVFAVEEGDVTDIIPSPSPEAATEITEEPVSAPVEPDITSPAITEIPTEPEVAEPTHVVTVTIKSDSIEPTEIEPTATEPTTTEPTTTEPTTTEPTTIEPVAVEPDSETTESTEPVYIEVESSPSIDSLEPEKGLSEDTPEGITLLRSSLGDGVMLRNSASSTDENTGVGARSATSSNGDVFLGGNYLEVGISKGGSFGTSMPAPSDFHSHASGNYDYSVGLLMDGDGWDQGNAPTTGDFFLPGSPEERYGIAYEIDGARYQYFVADRRGISNDGFEVYTTDDSDIENGLLKATVHGVTPHNVVVENVYSFGVDDKYYRTEVKIINNSGKELSYVRFFRSFDPDQDVDLHGGNYYETYNKVICNPDSSKPGGSSNFAMVVARGSYTLEGFFLVSFDNRARASRGVSFAPNDIYMSGLWVESTPGLPTSSTDEAIEMSFSNKNGYIYEDSAIAMTFNIGTLAAGESTELSHFSSLDPDVIDSLNKIKDAINATVDNTTDNTLTIVVEEGYEYSIDGGQTWSTTGVFEGLDPDTEYTILTRPINGTEEETTEVVVSTKKTGPETPDISERVVTENSIVVKGGENYEYSIDGGETWQDSPEFNSLNPDTEYTIVARIKGTDDTMPGKNSNPLTITTLTEPETDLDDIGVTVIASLNGSIDSLRINKGELYEAIGDDEDIAEAIENGQDIEIRFIINDSNLSSEEKELVNSELRDGETIALTVDISIELYIDDVFVKNIKEFEKAINFTLALPENILNGNKNFAVILTHENTTGEYTVIRIADGDGETKTFIVSSKEFSKYTFVCEKEKTTTAASTVATTEGGSGTGSTVSVESTPGVTVTHLSSPGTGDQITLCIVLLTLASFGFVLSLVYERRELLA